MFKEGKCARRRKKYKTKVGEQRLKEDVKPPE
jgi:hypothetical protein